MRYAPHNSNASSVCISRGSTLMEIESNVGLLRGPKTPNASELHKAILYIAD
jgi:hypothetical protein